MTSPSWKAVGKRRRALVGVVALKIHQLDAETSRVSGEKQILTNVMMWLKSAIFKVIEASSFDVLVASVRRATSI